jgi:hypothetical protein
MSVNSVTIPVPKKAPTTQANVSSFLKNSGSKEVILPPKLVADKLFLSSIVCQLHGLILGLQ